MRTHNNCEEIATCTRALPWVFVSKHLRNQYKINERTGFGSINVRIFRSSIGCLVPEIVLHKYRDSFHKIPSALQRSLSVEMPETPKGSLRHPPIPCAFLLLSILWYIWPWRWSWRNHTETSPLPWVRVRGTRSPVVGVFAEQRCSGRALHTTPDRSRRSPASSPHPIPTAGAIPLCPYPRTSIGTYPHGDQNGQKG